MKLISKDLLYLEDIFYEIIKIEKAFNVLNTSSMFDDHHDIINDAIIRNFIVIGEAFNCLSDLFKIEYPNLPYSKIKGLRNIIVHQYDDVNLELINKIIINDIPILKSQIAKIIDEIK
jgi:uncharacterized protein with HEPN domain